MPLTKEQQRHLEDCWKATDVRWAGEKARDQYAKVGIARAKGNKAAVPIAYMEAAMEAMRKRVEMFMEVTIRELDNIGLVIDRSVEDLVVKRIKLLTSMSMPLHFPPMMEQTQPITIRAVQAEFVRARERLRTELYAEAANSIRAVRLKSHCVRQPPSEQTGAHNTYVYNVFGSNTRFNQNSFDVSCNLIIDNENPRKA